VTYLQVAEFPKYGVNREGQVRNLKTMQEVNPCLNGSGVAVIRFRDDHNQIHSRGLAKLVARMYIPRNLDAFDTPIHLDGDRMNCAVDNLMWRPRWHAILYHKQFRKPYSNPIERPLTASDSDDVYTCTFDAATRYGLLEEDVVRGIIEGGPVWPVGVVFDVL
jgi:hypothetical protein